MHHTEIVEEMKNEARSFAKKAYCTLDDDGFAMKYKDLDTLITTTAQKIKQQTAKDILTFFPLDVCTDGEYTDAEMVACLSGVLNEVRRKIEEISKVVKNEDYEWDGGKEAWDKHLPTLNK